MSKSDGKTKKTPSRRKKRVSVHKLQGLGAFSKQGKINGIEPNRFSREDSQGRDTTRTDVLNCEGSNPIGKILERLELLEVAFEQYVGSHRDRLEARLAENKDFSGSFREEMQLIKREIYALAKADQEDLVKPDQPPM